jgi:hypothetical protein
MKLVQSLFLVWWLFSGGAGFIAYLCAKSFWRDYRKKKAEGKDYQTAFWTFFLFACFALEAVVTVVASPFTSADNPPMAGLVVAIVRRTILTLGMWLWWLKS